MPSLNELMDEVFEWWKEIDPLLKLEQPVENVSKLIVKKGITTDIDTALKLLMKYLGKNIAKA